MFASDWPQFRGPNRDGISSETGLLKEWPKAGPPLVWTFHNAGVGYSGPAVVGDRVYLLGTRGDSELLFALDAKSGAEVWAGRIGPIFTFEGNAWGDGPRATPTVEGGAVYSLGGSGILSCSDATTGQKLWRKNLPKDLNGEVNPIGGGPEVFGWGFTASPLVDGDHVICVPGGKDGTLAALDKKTGNVVWRSKELTDLASYSSPLVAEVNGVRQYIYLSDRAIAGVAAKDGSLLWYYEHKPPYKDVVIPSPLYHENHVYVAVGYGSGCDLIKLTADGGKFKAEKVYANKNMVNTQGGVVLVGDHVYGYSDGKGWVCQEFKTGKLVWSERRKLGAGSVTFADGHLYCFGEEDGVLALVEADPKAWKEKARFEIPQHSKLTKPRGKVWTHPVIADGHLYLRDQELLFCFKIKG